MLTANTKPYLAWAPERVGCQCLWQVGGVARAPGGLTSLSWSRELLRRELVASRKLSSSLLRSPPLDTATFIWGQGETGSASTDLTSLYHWPLWGRRGHSQGQAPSPTRPGLNGGESGGGAAAEPFTAQTGDTQESELPAPGQEAAASSVLSTSHWVTLWAPQWADTPSATLTW